MTFDGNDQIDGALPLLSPFAYHPHAPATGVVPAYALHVGYTYARAAQRLIGYQTYRERLLTTINSPYAFSASSAVGIAEFRVRLPLHATWVFVESYYSILGTGLTYDGRLQVSITDGGANTDTGVTTTETREAGGYQNTGVIGAAGFGYYDYARMHRSTAGVQRVNTRGSIVGSDLLTITATAFATQTGTSSGVAYKPHLIVCWYESIGTP